MKNNKILFILLILSIVGQLLIIGFSEREYYIFPFATGLKRTLTYDISMLNILYIYFPIIFILFYFNGKCHDLLHGYGKLLIVRNYSKTRLLLKEYSKIMISLVIIISSQIIIFCFGEFKWEILDINIIIKVLVMYLLTLFTILLLAYYLEIFMEPQYVVSILNIYNIISIYINYKVKKNIIVNILFFPGLLNGESNGAINNINQYIVSIITITIISLLIIILTIIKNKKVDVY